MNQPLIGAFVQAAGELPHAVRATTAAKRLLVLLERPLEGQAP